MGYRIVVAGATGNVGREMLNILAERQFPVDEIAAVASSRSQGEVIDFGDSGKTLKVQNIENFDFLPGSDQTELAASQAEALERLSLLIQRLKPLDRQIIVSYLEGLDASSIGEITGLSPANISMKVHRIKNILKRWFGEGGPHGE